MDGADKADLSYLEPRESGLKRMWSGQGWKTGTKPETAWGGACFAFRWIVLRARKGPRCEPVLWRGDQALDVNDALILHLIIDRLNEGFYEIRMMQRFIFQARDSAGRPVKDYVEASTLDQAKYTLEIRGYREIEFLTDESQQDIERMMQAGGASEAPPIDPELWSAQDHADAMQRKGIGAHLWWAAKQHLVFVLPLAWWNYCSWTGGRPFGWGDWLGFVLTPLYAVYFFKLSLPFMIFQKIMEASVWCNWAEVRRFVSWARVMRRFMITGIPESELDFREAQALSAQGNLDGALAKVERWRKDPDMPPHMFLTRLSSIYENAGDYAAMLACVEDAAKMTPEGVNQWIEIASVKIRRLRDVAGAKAALEKTGDAELAVLPAAFKKWVQGMIATEEGDDMQALACLTEALEKLKAFAGNPLIQLLEVEAKGYLVIVEARLGRREEAGVRFSEVRALLRLNRPNDLYPRCEASVAR